MPVLSFRPKPSTKHTISTLAFRAIIHRRSSSHGGNDRLTTGLYTGAIIILFFVGCLVIRAKKFSKKQPTEDNPPQQDVELPELARQPETPPHVDTPVPTQPPPAYIDLDDPVPTYEAATRGSSNART